MRVLQVSPYVAPAFGGPSKVVFDLARECGLAGIDVTVLSTNAGLSQAEKETTVDQYRMLSAKLILFDASLVGGWFFSRGMARWLRQNLTAFDLVHLHVPFTYPFQLGGRMARRAGVPAIASLHGVLDFWSRAYKPVKKALYLALVERTNLNGMQCLLLTSQLEARDIALLNLTSQTRIISLPVSSVSQANRTAQPGGSLHIVCVARLHPVKALPVLLRAVALAASGGLSVMLTIAGGGDEAYRAELEAEAVALGLGNSVRFLGRIDGQAVAELLGNADVFALLSHHENFGLAAAEAMASGLPVILSDQVGLADDVVETGAGAVVPVGDVEATAAAIRLLADGSRRELMGNRARQLAETKYSSHRYRLAIDQLYRQLAVKLQ